jgi:hypothetical protein
LSSTCSGFLRSRRDAAACVQDSSRASFKFIACFAYSAGPALAPPASTRGLPRVARATADLAAIGQRRDALAPCQSPERACCRDAHQPHSSPTSPRRGAVSDAGTNSVGCLLAGRGFVSVPMPCRGVPHRIADRRARCLFRRRLA